MGGSGSIKVSDYPKAGEGETRTGSYHSHPYSQAEGGFTGVSFSGPDVSVLAQGLLGNKMYVIAGDCIFVLTTCDEAKARKCKSKDIKKRWDDAFKAADGTFQEKVEEGVKAAIKGCGLCYYKTCRGPEDEQIPKTANLVANDCKECK